MNILRNVKIGALLNNSLNSCWRPICSVFGTAALCDALVVRSVV